MCATQRKLNKQDKTMEIKLDRHITAQYVPSSSLSFTISHTIKNQNSVARLVYSFVVMPLKITNVGKDSKANISSTVESRTATHIYSHILTRTQIQTLNKSCRFIRTHYRHIPAHPVHTHAPGATHNAICAHIIRINFDSSAHPPSTRTCHRPVSSARTDK